MTGRFLGLARPQEKLCEGGSVAGRWEEEDGSITGRQEEEVGKPIVADP